MFRQLAVPVTATNLYAFLDSAQIRCDKGVAFQAPLANVANVYFGDSASQPGFISPGSSSDVLPINRLDSIFLKGTLGDLITVMVF